MISVDPDRDLDGVLSVTDLAAKLNAEARIATEDVLVFLDDGIFHSDLDDIRELAGFAMQPEIGAVGGRIIAQDHLVEEAGLVLDPDLTPHASHGGYPKDAPGNIYRNQLISNYSAISAACFAIRRELFEEMGGFDTSSELFDVDLCLRLRERGKRIVVVPQVELERKLDAAVRQSSTEGLARFRRRWLNYVTQDPFCNPNLKRDGSFEIDV
jgi:GT2 family glycosyltransferase